MTANDIEYILFRIIKQCYDCQSVKNQTTVKLIRTHILYLKTSLGGPI